MVSSGNKIDRAPGLYIGGCSGMCSLKSGRYDHFSHHSAGKAVVVYNVV